LFDEGSLISSTEKRVPIAKVRGRALDLLRVERLALNVLVRCSAIATKSRSILDLVRSHDYQGQIAATRKTTPLFRLVEKYGVIVGGCSPHRYDVSSMCMLKDNHIDLFGGDVQLAVRSARSIGGFSMMVEVECRSLQDAIDAAEAGAHVVMLDNSTPDQVKHDSQILKSKFPHTIVEVSGGLNEHNILSYLTPTVDVYSMGCLIESVPAVDFSMKIDPPVPN